MASLNACANEHIQTTNAAGRTNATTSPRYTTLNTKKSVRSWHARIQERANTNQYANDELIAVVEGSKATILRLMKRLEETCSICSLCSLVCL